MFLDFIFLCGRMFENSETITAAVAKEDYVLDKVRASSNFP